ncbi:MAG: c-type cytochrome [Chloracidobacterium sp.]|nr:c-type cytochrome [Chloracidobacterium sp.]MCC6824854.1 c-type cytochrome [Acidobacteriota bacterium]MCO5334933.1 c-type cytochrome [Pyrinomonadaceae bacterium]
MKQRTEPQYRYYHVFFSKTSSMTAGGALIAMLCVIFLTGAVFGQDAGQQIFETRCYSCHNIGGGDKQGPDLKGVTDRQSEEWLQEFIKGPQAMAKKDPAAADLFKKFAPTVMPDQSLTPDEFQAIISLIKSITANDGTFVPSGAKLSREIEPGDVEAGRLLFTGATKLANGGAACNSCHNLSGVGEFGGGTLGPDLTAVNIKYTDPELILALENPNFPTMKSLFETRKLTDDEIVKLFALFQNSKLNHPTANVVPTAASSKIEPGFLIIGFAVAIIALIGMNLRWRKRNHGVRQELVRRATK